MDLIRKRICVTLSWRFVLRSTGTTVAFITGLLSQRLRWCLSFGWIGRILKTCQNKLPMFIRIVQSQENITKLQRQKSRDFWPCNFRPCSLHRSQDSRLAASQKFVNTSTVGLPTSLAWVLERVVRKMDLLGSSWPLMLQFPYIVSHFL